jgi:xanthine dehydrogenase accessory factor
MFNEIALKIQEYYSKGSNFAIAQVIDREAPSSGKIGDKAIILETGELIGWIGGGCIRGIIIKESLEVIKTKRYRRIRISPEGGSRESNHFKEYVMSCQSRGTVEVLIEPVLPQPELIIVGKSNIARKLAALATVADFKVSVVARDFDQLMFSTVSTISDVIDFDSIIPSSNTYIIVTTQGEDDELSVKKALLSSAKYVGFVASIKKSEDIREYLAKEGISQERINQLRSPVGLDINAKLASEVAISILAEVIDHFRKENKSDTGCCDTVVSEQTSAIGDQDKFSEEYYINPVCQVPVSKKNPKHIVEYQGEKVYFCCDGCKVSFDKNPSQYMGKTV